MPEAQAALGADDRRTGPAQSDTKSAQPPRGLGIVSSLISAAGDGRRRPLMAAADAWPNQTLWDGGTKRDDRGRHIMTALRQEPFGGVWRPSAGAATVGR